MIHGTGADQLDIIKQRAKQVIIDTLVARAEADGVPATLRAMYAIKTSEARSVLTGGTSSFLEKEALLRKTTVLELSKMIVAMSEESEALELQRVMIGLRIEGASDPATVVAELERIGLRLPDDRV